MNSFSQSRRGFAWRLGTLAAGVGLVKGAWASQSASASAATGQDEVKKLLSPRAESR